MIPIWTCPRFLRPCLHVCWAGAGRREVKHGGYFSCESDTYHPSSIHTYRHCVRIRAIRREGGKVGLGRFLLPLVLLPRYQFIFFLIFLFLTRAPGEAGQTM